MPGEHTEKSTSLYNAIEYRYSEQFLISLADHMRVAEPGSEAYMEARDLFRLTSEALYGRPDQQIFGALAERHIKPFLAKDYPVDSPAARLASDLNQRVGNVHGDAYTPYVANADTVAKI